ncbi:DUF3696 domain-containing protein [Candidatus Palauibacter sp.]|uniref:AAA family ATPase n=1 Tax=Candidatus Palauibacter sp. TaxID=3101350 RepID=UPI003B024D0F
MLTRVKLENFKAWREADLTFGKVTGLFGANSAGKSSLFHLLLLLKQTKNATDRNVVLDFGGRTELVNLGTFADVVHRNDEAKVIRWLLEWKLPKTLTIRDPLQRPATPLFEGDTLQTRYEVGFDKTRLLPGELAYRFNDVDFLLQPRASSKQDFNLIADTPTFSFIRNPGRAWPLPGPVKTHLFPSQAKSYYQNTAFLGDFELAYENLMDSIYYLGPLREYPQREYHWAGSRPADVGQRGERTVDALLAATLKGKQWSLGYKMWKKTFQEMIAHWLRQLGLIREFYLEEIAKGTNLYRVMAKTSPWSVPTPLTDVGFGVSQVLPVLVLLYYVPEGSTVLMEQPEIHLHPAVQSGLADVMLNVAKVRNVQIVVESHSEHLMRRLQRRVAEGTASSEDVKLYFVSPHRGEARVSDLLLNEWGEIENWPDKFFGDEMGEIAAISKASLKRKIEETE